MASGRTSSSPSLLETVERIAQLRLTGPWPELRKLMHEDARLESIAAGGLFGPDETVNAMRLAAADGVYTMGDWRIEELGGNALLLLSTMRHLAKLPNGAKGMTDASYVWLMIGRDGLLWRMKIFRNKASAVEHLRRHGESLGI
jgi:hypothetical protein